MLPYTVAIATKTDTAHPIVTCICVSSREEGEDVVQVHVGETRDGVTCCLL